MHVLLCTTLTPKYLSFHLFSAVTKPAGAFPTRVPYLLIGAGTASFAALRAIRANDATAKVSSSFDKSYLSYLYKDTDLGKYRSV